MAAGGVLCLPLGTGEIAPKKRLLADSGMKNTPPGLFIHRHRFFVYF
jgi:hypothetical protein